jgi:hypothetical protein
MAKNNDIDSMVNDFNSIMKKYPSTRSDIDNKRLKYVRIELLKHNIDIDTRYDIERLEKSIADLENRLKNGNVYGKVSEANCQLYYDKLKLEELKGKL